MIVYCTAGPGLTLILSQCVRTFRTTHFAWHYFIYFAASRSPGGPHDPMSAVEMTRLALLKMYGAAPPVSLPNLPPLPGLPADILQQAQQQQDRALNLHLQRQQHRAADASVNSSEADRVSQKELQAKEDRLRSAEDTEDEAVDDLDKKSNNEDAASSMHNDNSLSPPPPHQLTPSSNKKRHRSNDSEDIEEVSSPKKHHTGPLGLPGANIKIASRGNYNSNSNQKCSLQFLAEQIGMKLGRLGSNDFLLPCRLDAISLPESRNLYQQNLCPSEFCGFMTPQRSTEIHFVLTV